RHEPAQLDDVEQPADDRNADNEDGEGERCVRAALQSICNAVASLLRCPLRAHECLVRCYQYILLSRGMSFAAPRASRSWAFAPAQRVAIANSTYAYAA